MELNKNITNSLPPFFSIFESALSPRVVKKPNINGSCNDLLKDILKSKTVVRKSIRMAKTRPPDTGSGMSYLFRNLIFFVKNLPVNNTAIIIRKVEYILKSSFIF